MTLLILSALVSFAWADQDSAAACAARLSVPARFAPQFAAYTDQRFVTPFPSVAFSNGGQYAHLTLRGNGNDDSDDPEAYEVWVALELVGGDHPRKLIVRDLRLTDQVEPEFAYRTILAHLLDRYPGVREVDFEFFGLPDYGRLRGALARGVGLREAVMDTDAYRAFAAFGFTLKTPQFKFINASEPFELILRMRLTREPDAS